MSNEAARQEKPDAETLLQQRRERAQMARCMMIHAFEMRNSANALCDFLTNWSLSDDEVEALELFTHVHNAWACVKATYRLTDIAISGA